jgi:ribosomal protein S18 acetylase RimI-like enzyme
METTLISDAKSDADFETARALFEEYASSLAVDLCFQNFSEEVQRIRDIYGPPRGGLLLARQSGSVVGCVALRPLEVDVCEMKRLYVRPAARGGNVGRQLAIAMIDRARGVGYRRMVLDTLVSMKAAEALYRSLGFKETAPYYVNPLPDAVYMELELSEGLPQARGKASE